MNGRILTSCNVLTNFKDRNKLKKCLIESTIETLERQTTMEPLLITNTTGTPITKNNFKKVSLCAKTITKNLSGAGIGIKCYSYTCRNVRYFYGYRVLRMLLLL